MNLVLIQPVRVNLAARNRAIFRAAFLCACVHLQPAVALGVLGGWLLVASLVRVVLRQVGPPWQIPPPPLHAPYTCIQHPPCTCPPSTRLALPDPHACAKRKG
eukprot:m.826910 g.826910  ORF g.826910 m.826910 type:complete len:103 (-) comp59424_c0_seq2:1245-1553(-)